MTQKKTVTYEMFLEVVQKMEADGIVPTVRAVVVKTRGSHSTIQGHWRRWLQSRSAATRVGHMAPCYRIEDLRERMRGRGGDGA